MSWTRVTIPGSPCSAGSSPKNPLSAPLLTPINKEALVHILEWIRQAGPAGMAVFAGVYVLACLLFIPGSLLTLGAGVIYGVAKGTALVSVSATLGAAAAFLVARYFARGFVERKLAQNPKFKAMDEAVAKEGWKIVGLARLSPVFPFNLLNYAFGLTQIRFKDYVPASFIGMIPGTLLYVYLGSLAGDLASLFSGSGGDSPERVRVRWAVRIIGFIATALVTFFIARLAGKVLKEKVPDP